MAQKRAPGRPKAVADDPPVIVASSPPPSMAPPSEAQLARLALRGRWELASVLNFLNVFKEPVGADLKIAAEEIETGLITPNGDLAQVHISLLKGIPPTSKNMRENDAWITVVCKKLSTWWPWVAEGENPLKADHGEEIERYRELDPTTRLLILKALCEVRALQDDIVKYITDGLKSGTPITDFRKERIGLGDDGSTYWYDGDEVIGYRLYKEITGVGSKKKLKGNAHLTQPTIESQWETLATNLDEFREISDKLSSSQIMAEAAVGEMVNTDIIPVLEEIQKKKQRALKRQQTQAMQLDCFLYSDGISSRLTRERKPVKYTFDDYDKTIDEAIEICKKRKTTVSSKDSRSKVEQGVVQQDSVMNGSIDSDKENSNPADDNGSLAEDDDNGKHGGRSSDDDNGKHRGRSSDDDDDDYDEKNDGREGYNDDEDGGNDSVADDGDDYDEDDSVGDSDEEELSSSPQDTRGQKGTKGRTTHPRNKNQHAEAKGHAEMKKRLRQRPTRNTDYRDCNLSDSDDDFM